LYAKELPGCFVAANREGSANVRAAPGPGGAVEEIHRLCAAAGAKVRVKAPAQLVVPRAMVAEGTDGLIQHLIR
jgi:hypothetical protein